MLVEVKTEPSDCGKQHRATVMGCGRVPVIKNTRGVYQDNTTDFLFAGLMHNYAQHHQKKNLQDVEI